MRTKILCCLISVILGVCFALPAMAASVAQGKCVAYDDAKKVLVIEEFDTKFTKEHKYGQPTGKQASFDVTDALVGGGTPKPGDLCRIAYEEKGDKKVAVRVMNITKTDIMRK
ncbi:MAG: hypothetical protein HY913_20330 [Desulfomonile tiedjei]|nr:hypothetical protein [Desulfomonile tiedjei]